jgi:predicted enzyme related to lactoylglutathione lyase
MPTTGTIDYIELPASDLPSLQVFYKKVFDWGGFKDYGPDYVAFEAQGRDGGFNGKRKVVQGGGPLLVLYSRDLEDTEAKVKEAGGEIVEHEKFPGGRRFTFRDPNGNELAVWTKR